MPPLRAPLAPPSELECKLIRLGLHYVSVFYVLVTAFSLLNQLPPALLDVLEDLR